MLCYIYIYIYMSREARMENTTSRYGSARAGIRDFFHFVYTAGD